MSRHRPARTLRRHKPTWCLHTMPLHEGWTVDETIAWLAAGLKLPDVEPPLWVNVGPQPKSECEMCRAEEETGGG